MNSSLKNNSFPPTHSHPNTYKLVKFFTTLKWWYNSIHYDYFQVRTLLETAI